MKDEKPIETDTEFLSRMLVTGFCEGYASDHKELVAHVSGMIGARVKTAERIAKIEILEELLESINTPCIERYASSYEEGIRDKRNDDIETIEARILELNEEY